MKEPTELVYVKQLKYNVYKIKVVELLNAVKNNYELQKLINNKCKWIENEGDEPYDFVIGLQFLSLLKSNSKVYLLHPDSSTQWSFSKLNK